jgi:hypothetical protein
MHAISLTQPWASAIALGLKNWETRSWHTNYRGPLAIHAAKGFPRWAKDFAREENFMLRLPKVEELPLGAIVCVCELTDCRPTQSVSLEIGDLERKYGDYHEGRYAYKLENVRPLAESCPCVGSRRFWPVNMELWMAIRECMPGRKL